MGQIPTLTPEGLRRFLSLNDEAVEAVVHRFYRSFPALYEPRGARGRVAAREDVRRHLEILRPTLELGILRPLIDDLRLLAVVLGSNGIPDDHVELSLAWLAEFFAARLSPEDAQPVAAAFGAAVSALRNPSDDDPPYEPPTPEPSGKCDAFGAALVRGDQRASLSIFREISNHGRTFLEAELHLVQPAMYAIGKGWRENRISIAQEHMATAMVHGLLAREFATAEPSPPDGRSVALAGVEGNQHAMGLRMVADAFELAGWDVRYIGPDTPTVSLVEMVGDWRPDLVGLSATMPHHLRPARDAISSLRAEMGESCPPVLLGGPTINRFSPPVAVLGAAGTAPDARSAVATASRLVPSR